MQQNNKSNQKLIGIVAIIVIIAIAVAMVGYWYLNKTARHNLSQTTSDHSGIIVDEHEEATGVGSDDGLSDSDLADEYDPEVLNQSVQDTLTYMGGLYVNGDPQSDMELAIFRNDDGNIVYIIYELGGYEYGFFTAQDAKTDGGTAYTQLSVDNKTYGYSFNQDLTGGILINAAGQIYSALALDESVARDMVRATIVGE